MPSHGIVDNMCPEVLAIDRVLYYNITHGQSPTPTDTYFWLYHMGGHEMCVYNIITQTIKAMDGR